MVGYSKLKELDINDSFKRKQKNEEMEAKLIKLDSKTDNLEVTEESNVYDDIPIDLRKERRTQAYKETMSIDIENIDTFETINIVNTIKWRPIFEVIDEAYFIGSKIFSDDFIIECKDNSNEAHDIPREVKNNNNRMAI